MPSAGPSSVIPAQAGIQGGGRGFPCRGTRTTRGASVRGTLRRAQGERIGAELFRGSLDVEACRACAPLLRAVVEPDVLLERVERPLRVAVLALADHRRARRSQDPVVCAGRGVLAEAPVNLRGVSRPSLSSPSPPFSSMPRDPRATPGDKYRIRGGDGGESNSPSKRRQAQMYYRLIRRFLSGGPSTGGLPERFAASLRRPLAASGTQHPNYIALTVTAGAGHRGVVALLTQPGRVRCRQLVVCRLIREWAANSACNPTQQIPCRKPRIPNVATISQVGRDGKHAVARVQPLRISRAISRSVSRCWITFRLS